MITSSGDSALLESRGGGNSSAEHPHSELEPHDEERSGHLGQDYSERWNIQEQQRRKKRKKKTY
jgi:hypothetical protein